MITKHNIVEIAKYILCTYIQVGSKVHRRSDGRASGSSHVEDKENAMTPAGSEQMQRQRQIHYSTFRQGSCKKLHHQCHHVMAACGKKRQWTCSLQVSRMQPRL